MPRHDPIRPTAEQPAGPSRRSLLLLAAGASALDVSPLAHPSNAKAQTMPNGADNFYTSEQVTLTKVTFPTQYSMKVAGNLFVTRNLSRGARLPALVVGHPMGAVEEQSANLYATKMAEQGFAAMAIDTCRSGARARASRAMRSCPTCTPRRSAPRWTSSAPMSW